MMKKLILGMFVVAVSMFGLQNSANATLISQDIYFTDSTAGSTSVLYGNISLDVGILDEFNEVGTWQSFTLGGISFDAALINNIFEFFAEIDPTDVAGGIVNWGFDISDAVDNAISGDFNSTDGYGGLEFFDTAANLTVDGKITLGQATVVPEPAALLLMLTAFGALAISRRKF